MMDNIKRVRGKGFHAKAHKGLNREQCVKYAKLKNNKLFFSWRAFPLRPNGHRDCEKHGRFTRVCPYPFQGFNFS